jgi:hypothetical protein
VSPSRPAKRRRGCDLRRGALLDGAEAALEFGVGPAERRLGVDLEVARDVDHREQDIADLVDHALRRAAALQLRAEIGDVPCYR